MMHLPFAWPDRFSEDTPDYDSEGDIKIFSQGAEKESRDPIWSRRLILSQGFQSFPDLSSPDGKPIR